MAADLLKDAQDRYREAMEASHEQRVQIGEDLRFTDPACPQQWDEVERRQRETDPGGSRPCLVMDQLGQYISNVAGQIEQRTPSLHALPVDGGADKQVAEQLDGLFRHVEHVSRAQSHYARALTSAARVGVGYLVVRPEVVDRSLRYKEPRISSEGDPLRVLFDPWSVELDGSDATFAQLLQPLSYAEFERQFGKRKKASFGEDEEDADRKQVMLVEEWRVVETEQVVVQYLDAQGGEAVLPKDEFEALLEREPATYVREFRDQVRRIRWARMSGAEVLSEDRDYPAEHVGIVPVYGYVSWSDGRMRYCGIGRRAREPQRAYNYHMSEIRAYMTQAPKAPWVAPVRAVRGLEEQWDRASVDARAYLPYHDVDEMGAIAAPSRSPIATNLQNHIQGALTAREDIQAAIGMYQANLGAPSNETSGVAIDARKQQGESATAHFPAHLAASIGGVGKIVMQMLPRLIDTRRQVRILGIDGASGSVVFDPGQREAVRDDGGLSVNPNVGKYDVRVVVGASFATQRAQAQAAFTEMMRANPAMTPAIAPLWAQTLDVPHADKLAQVLTAVSPPEVKAVLSPEQEEGPKVPDLIAQVQQLQQALQAAIAEAESAQNDADQALEEARAAKAAGEAKEDEISIKAYQAFTERLKAIGVQADEAQLRMLAEQSMASAMGQPVPTDDPVDTPVESPAEPPGPSVEQQLLASMLDGQQQMMAMLGRMLMMQAQPRRRVPIRDKRGEIVEVIDEARPLPDEMQ